MPGEAGESIDFKPLLNQRNGQDLPPSVRMGQRLTGMSGNQAVLPLAGSIYKFGRHGKGGLWVSELLPHTANIVDDLCIVRSMYTEAINHDPAITFRSGKGPVLYLGNPDGISREGRRLMLDRLRELHEQQKGDSADPEIDARIAQYEMAFRLQSAVPEVVDNSREPASIFELYGPDSRKPGTFASNCLLARRLAERGVKFIQLYHQGWDHHGNLPKGIVTQCKETDQPAAALVADLKQRGMLEETLVIWGGEFGRTNYSQGKLTSTDHGRDHHPRCFTTWMAGGGVKAGVVYGETCEFGYNVVRDPVHVHDFHAALLHLLGIDHEQLTYKHQGRRFRLTDVSGQVVSGILA